MAILVVAEPREEFDRWRKRQLAPANPAGPNRQAGEKIFTSGPCAMCHQIQRTTAASGPDLTHVGSRATIAAGALQMTRGNLAAWIADPQGIKPGAKMPATNLSPDELNHLVDYLEGLK